MTVFTNGCFDLCHAGHVALLRFCRRLAGPAGRVIVAINSDASVARLKGPGRPIMSEPERAASIHMLNLVDTVFAFEGDDPTSDIERIRPDILVKGSEYRDTDVPGARFSDRVEFAPMIPGVSTTLIIQGLAECA